MLMNRLITWLEKELSDRGWSMRLLAKRAEISVATVSNVMAGKTPATFDFCAAIARPLGKRPEELFRMAGLLPSIRSSGSEISEEEFLELLPLLSPEQRRNLRQYAEFLISQAERTGEAEGRPATEPGS
jgi:transcriptional regulator with XRE-family HTH domain